MAQVLPFRALRYHPRFAAEMGRLAAPPYDVIGEGDRLRYVASHPKNVVRLILPGEAGIAEDGTFYSGAADLLGRWRREGTLVEDPLPALYPYRQTFVGPDGSRASRLGFLGALALEDTAKGVGVLPHEKTLEGPRRDRTRLIAACQANLSPVFLLHPDSLESVGPDLESAASENPLFHFTDDREVLHELWRLDDPARIARLQEGMEADWTLIADGHHRYESALAVMKELPAVEGARRVLAFFCSLRDKGFRIFPIHRLVRRGVLAESSALRSVIQQKLSCRPLPEAEPDSVLARLRQEGEGSFVALLPEGPPLLLRTTGAARGTAQGGTSGLLDTQLLQRKVLTGVLGITPEMVEAGAVAFTPDAAEAHRQVNSGEAAVAFLMNPLRVEGVIEAARAGVRLPQKSTYFYPKVFTGLVFRPF